MKIEIKQLDKSLPIPKYQTLGAAGFDFYIRIDEIIKPGEFKLIPTGVALKFPKGHFLLINSRSSTYHRFGLLIIPGIADQDFCGDEDEYKIQVLNLSKKTVKLGKGTRIAQGVLVKITQGKIKIVQSLQSKNRRSDTESEGYSRGMLGTTGHN